MSSTDIDGLSDHLDVLRARQRTVDHLHDHGIGASAGAWRQARRDVLITYLLEQMGIDDIAALAPDEQRILRWLAGWDADTVAGVARLIELGAERR